MEYEEFIKYTQKMTKNIETLLKDHEEELDFWLMLVRSFNKICEEKNNLEQALDEIGNILNGVGEMACYSKSMCLYKEDIEDILKIIQKAKGDVKNENNNV